MSFEGEPPIIISDDEFAEFLANMFRPREGYSIDDSTKDLTMFTNVLKAVKEGFIEETGVVRGRGVQMWAGKSTTEQI
jgi:hypothetical protein